MALAKTAQFWEDENDVTDIMQINKCVICGGALDNEGRCPKCEMEDLSAADDEVDSDGGVEGEGTIVVELDGDNPVGEEFSFVLPKVPGADLDDEDDFAISVEEPEEEVRVGEQDVWDYGALSNFMPWLSKMFSSVPRHNGYETSGLERAISYLGVLDKSISRAVRSDLKEELDIPQVEKARQEIQDGIDRLEERLNRILSKKKKKKADFEPGLVKEAQKITGVKGIMITVPLIISRAARVCINGYVSAGHDIEDLFQKQVDRYKFDIVQQAELMQLLEDMGYPLRRDRGFLLDEEIDATSTDNMDWAANYPA